MAKKYIKMIKEFFLKMVQHCSTSLKYGAVMAILCTISNSFAADLPTGGEITAGSGSISQSSTVMDIWQNTHSLSTNWDSFSIGAGNTVNFHQPAADAVALNYIRGNEASQIYGSLNANGQVFLINPNGVLFAPGSQVDVGGLVASTMNLSQVNFDSNNFKFFGDSTNAIINQGNIHINDGGTVAFIAAKITNSGNITASEGNVLMAAGNAVTLDMGGVIKIKVDEGALNTLIDQGGAIKADGGYVYLTAKSAGDLTTSVVNQSGIIEAKTLATGKKGEILLLGDMTQGTTKISGTLDASAPDGGDGGFIETSAANVEVSDGAKITAGAKFGKG